MKGKRKSLLLLIDVVAAEFVNIYIKTADKSTQQRG